MYCVNLYGKLVKIKTTTLPGTNIFAENGRSEDDCFLLGRLGLFSGAIGYVSFRECKV